MTTAEQLVVESVHSAAQPLPLAQRVELYRAHARTTARKRVALHLFECADELEAASNRCQQLAFDFRKTRRADQ